MERVAYRLNSDGYRLHTCQSAANLVRQERSKQLVSRHLLQVSGQQSVEDTDSVLFIVLIACGGIGLLVVIALSIVWCAYWSKRRARTPSSDGSGSSLLSDPDELSTDDDKASKKRKATNTPERKMAMSAQLYHYEKQKRELLAVEQAGRNETDSRASSPPFEDTITRGASNGNGSRRFANDTKVPNGGKQPDLLDNDDEEFAVYEYPGLASAVGQIEIDNPLFRTPSVDARDVSLLELDSDLSARSEKLVDLSVDSTKPNAHVSQHPDLLMDAQRNAVLQPFGNSKS